ncbi:hypothetical protein ACKAMS_24885 [Rhodococcus sp. 5A-K4]|uniref:hypothetical protein n=1 Tax=Rhodococcus sp. 5A-K4 TaxID=3384442 RepID=UPI0038D3A663
MTELALTAAASVWAQQSLLHDGLSVVTWVGSDGVRWPLSGGLAPIPPASGVLLQTIKGLGAPFTHIDQQGAHQDGVDYLDTAFDKAMIDMKISVQASDPKGYRRTFRQWLAGWDPHKQGKLSWYTQECGEWWIKLRAAQDVSDSLSAGAVSAAEFNWSARADFPFWSSFDSTSKTFIASASTDQGFLSLWNRGTEDGWPRYILQGPGIFTFGDNGGPRVLKMTLLAGQKVLMTSLPNRRTVRELNTNTNLYPNLVGRFSTPVHAGKEVHVPVTITGATPGVSSIAAALTPLRRWPE